jgi:hypothetical protein
MPRVGAVVDPAWTPKCRRPALCRVRYCSASGKIADRRPHDRVDCCSVRSADAENRIPEPNCNSSGWIRTIDLTIMSRAPWCEGRARAGAGSGEIHARRPFRRNLWLPGSSARIHVRGPVVDPEKRGCSWARGADLDGARAHLLSLIDPRSRGTVGLLSRGSQVRILPGASAGRSRDREIPAKGDPCQGRLKTHPSAPVETHPLEWGRVRRLKSGPPAAVERFGSVRAAECGGGEPGGRVGARSAA